LRSPLRPPSPHRAPSLFRPPSPLISRCRPEADFIESCVTWVISVKDSTEYSIICLAARRSATPIRGEARDPFRSRALAPTESIVADPGAPGMVTGRTREKLHRPDREATMRGGEGRVDIEERRRLPFHLSPSRSPLRPHGAENPRTRRRKS
jgi:hypothetical protein